MSRGKKASPADDLVELVAIMPWWVGVVLALIAYMVLHRVASQPAPIGVQPGQLGASVGHAMWVTLATMGQYLVPLICFLGAGASAWRRHERKSLVANVTKSSSADALNDMTWSQFEMLVGEGFRMQGYTVAETGGGGADGGIDLVLRRGGEKFLVQCKQWRARQVSVEVVRELYGVMADRGAAGGFVVTSGRFTDPATDFARGKNIKLLDGPQLHALIKQAKAGKGNAATEPSSSPRRDAPIAPPASAPAPAAASAIERAMAKKAALEPTCPVCSKAMVLRTAKRGASAGSAFWGCTGFPSCRGTRPVA
jgi:restriction system protein